MTHIEEKHLSTLRHTTVFVVQKAISFTHRVESGGVSFVVTEEAAHEISIIITHCAVQRLIAGTNINSQEKWHESLFFDKRRNYVAIMYSHAKSKHLNDPNVQVKLRRGEWRRKNDNSHLVWCVITVHRIHPLLVELLACGARVELSLRDGDVADALVVLLQSRCQHRVLAAGSHFRDCLPILYICMRAGETWQDSVKLVKQNFFEMDRAAPTVQ